MIGQSKPSKAMVLAGAIDYIKKIECERDNLVKELQRLRSVRYGWNKSRMDLGLEEGQ